MTKTNGKKSHELRKFTPKKTGIKKTENLLLRSKILIFSFLFHLIDVREVYFGRVFPLHIVQAMNCRC